ncbi:MAG TPA: hypothetical protein VNH14_09960 [Gemmatimonadales bacterium]|nr:hypothetical protein [Gemmatimonadales bacterium]
MEPVLDFGLFELLAASLLAWFARTIYTRRYLAVAFLALTLLAPAVLAAFPQGSAARWLAVVCLATALVNAAALFRLLRTGNLSSLLKKPATLSSVRGAPVANDGAGRVLTRKAVASTRPGTGQ